MCDLEHADLPTTIWGPDNVSIDVLTAPSQQQAMCEKNAVDYY